MRDLIIPLEKTFKDLSGQGPSVVSPSVVGRSQIRLPIIQSGLPVSRPLKVLFRRQDENKLRKALRRRS